MLSRHVSIIRLYIVLPTNWCLLVLLATRIWYVDRQRAHLAAEAAGSNLTPIVRVILESGAINAATLLAFVITLSVGSQGLEVISEMVGIQEGVVCSHHQLIKLPFRAPPWWGSFSPS